LIYPSRRGADLQFGFTEALQGFFSTTRKSQADVARGCWLDEGYVSRLRRGERSNPSRDTVILLAVYGLGLKLEETEELVLAAGYRPLRPRFAED
jgi:hypothetical protein